MKKPTKEKILNAYIAVRNNIGEKPTFYTFCKLSGISKSAVISRFRTFGDLVLYAGDKPVEYLKKVYEEDDFINAYISFIRAHNKVPNTVDWKFYDCKPGLGSFSGKFKRRWSEMPLVIYDRVKDNYDYKDVKKILEEKYGLKRKIELIRMEEDSLNEDLQKKEYYINNLDENLKVMTPSSVHDIVWLAHTSLSGMEFEQRCAGVLRMLGFDVTEYGQGTGRKPDGVAEDPINRYAVIYDAKSRTRHYTPGTDDRRIIEYIREERKHLMSQGYDVVYFLMISSAFGRISANSVFNIRAETGVNPSFITAENLLHLLSGKIQYPRRFDLLKFKHLLVPGGEIRKEEIMKIKN
jgi:hypothetical protein